MAGDFVPYGMAQLHSIVMGLTTRKTSDNCITVP